MKATRLIMERKKVMNKVILIGRLTRDPELSFTPGSGTAVTKFSIAVDRNYTGQDGKKEADFINIVCWRKLAEIVKNNLSKGRLVAVTGSLRTSNYQAQDGHKVYKTEIYADEVKFLDKPKNGQNSNEPTDNSGYSDGFIPVDDDDVPF
jgi:single-strand DNA-binding protein